MELIARNVNEAFPIMWHHMLDEKQGLLKRDSRNGPTVEFREPAVTTYKMPRERVLFLPVRDANPFFHLFEAIWMLAGRNDVAYLCRYLPRMMDYSDDGVTLNSAYGARWKELLPYVVDHLRKDPTSRRAYLPIFRPEDVFLTGKDMPCNTGVSFYIRDGQLDVAVFNRSNDMVWGAYGANVVHFSFLQEYVAGLLDIGVGRYSQVSSCFHLYTEFDITKRIMNHGVDPMPYDPYATGDVTADGPLVLSHPDEEDLWQWEAKIFFEFCEHGDDGYGWKHLFFRDLAVPMERVWKAYKEKDWDKANALVEIIQATDWRSNVRAWLRRRSDKRALSHARLA